MNKKEKKEIDAKTRKFYYLRDFSAPLMAAVIGIPFFVYSDFRINQAERLKQGKNLTFSEYALG